MSVTVTVPLNNGVSAPSIPQPATFTLQLPASAPSSGKVTWASSVGATGTVTPSNDGRSALFTPVGINSSTPTVITATVYGAEYGTWQPGKLYLLNEEILDSSHRVQKVVAAAKMFEARYTVLAGKIPQGGYPEFFASFAITSADNTASNATVYNVTTDLSAGLIATLPGKVLEIAGFITNKVNNGEFVVLSVASDGSTITVNNPNGVAETPTAGAIAQSIGTAADPRGDAYILNSDGGAPINPDWPLGATLQAGANTNGQVSNGGFTVKSGVPTTAAPVAFVAGGYSAGNSVGSLAASLPSIDGGQQGMDSYRSSPVV